MGDRPVDVAPLFGGDRAVDLVRDDTTGPQVGVVGDRHGGSDVGVVPHPREAVLDGHGVRRAEHDVALVDRHAIDDLVAHRLPHRAARQVDEGRGKLPRWRLAVGLSGGRLHTSSVGRHGLGRPVVGRWCRAARALGDAAGSQDGQGAEGDGKQAVHLISFFDTTSRRR